MWIVKLSVSLLIIMFGYCVVTDILRGKDYMKKEPKEPKEPKEIGDEIDPSNVVLLIFFLFSIILLLLSLAGYMG